MKAGWILLGEKIDLVITWVNGNDEKWRIKRSKYVKKTNKNIGNADNRYRDYGTLRFSLRSVEKYAPWINKIYIVTDDQRPDWLKDISNRIQIIDHKQIIPHDILPVFNSNVIEWYIDEIQGLSNEFIYMNDDIILNNPVKKKDFFKDGLPVDFRIYTDNVPLKDFNYIQMNNDILMNKYVKNKWPESKKGLIELKYGKKLLRNIAFGLQAKKTGIPGYLEEHGPYSFLKSSYQSVKEIWNKEIAENNKNRFRSRLDISIWLIRHYQLEKGIFYPRSYGANQYCSVNEITKIKKTLFHSKYKSICINDDNQGSYNMLRKKEELRKILLKKFPQKSMFEK